MKRLFLTFVSCLAMATCLSLVSCGKDEPTVIDLSGGTETPDEPENPDEPDDSSGQREYGGTLPVLHTDGRWLCDESGEHVNLHGFWQTYTPWFNGGAWGENNWGGKDYEACVAYNKRIIDDIVASGIKVDFMRMHLDPYWFISDGRGDAAVSKYFSTSLMKDYFEKVYLPIIKHCNSKGLYVVLRPYPCGEEKTDNLKYGDGFFKLLEEMWTYFSLHTYIRNNSDVMFELMNEPVGIDASQDGGDRAKAVSRYMQHFIDLIRNKCQNIIWVPGLTWQQEYNSFVSYPLKGTNLGFAVHCYPGWYGSDAESSTGENGGNMGQGVGGGYEAFQAGWNKSLSAAAELHPIMITEMDWASATYNKTWGKSFTGMAGGAGFGANFKYIMDKCGNVSYMTFTAPNDLALFPTESAKSYTNYWNDPEACPWQIYHWFEEYAQGRVQPESADYIQIGCQTAELNMVKGKQFTLIVNAVRNKVVFPLQSGVEFSSSDPSVARVDGDKLIAEANGVTTITASALGCTTTLKVVVSPKAVVEATFPFEKGKFNTDIWEKGSMNVDDMTFTTGQYGFAGWQYSPAADISGHKYIVVKLGNKTDFTGQPSFRLFDNGYWDGAAEYSITSSDEVKIDISTIKRADGSGFDTGHVTIIGFWTLGFKTVQLEDIHFED